MMGLYVEVMCDVRLDTGYWQDRPPYNYVTCHSAANNNPQGTTVASARKAAKKAGWLVQGSRTVCPYCCKYQGPQP